MSQPCPRTVLPEPPSYGLDPATDLVEAVSIIVAKLADLARLGLMAEFDHPLLENLLCVQLDYLEQAQALLDAWEPPGVTVSIESDNGGDPHGR